MKNLLTTLITVLITALLGTLVVAGPAGAQDDRSGRTDQPDRTDATDTTDTTDQPDRTDATDKPVQRPSDVGPADTPTDVRPDVEPEREHLRLHCNGRISDDGRAGVVCEWSEAQHRRATGYVLERVAEHTDPIVVLATRDLGVTRHVDGDIRVGVTYGYRVRVVDANGVNVGGSDWVRAGVEAPDPGIEVLKLACDARIVATDASRDERRRGGGAGFESIAVRCEWRAAMHPNAAGYQLWRIVDGGDRELVWRGGLDRQSHTSRVDPNTRVAVYALLAIDSAGEIVGRSRPEVVAFHDRADRPVPGVLRVR